MTCTPPNSMFCINYINYFLFGGHLGSEFSFVNIDDCAMSDYMYTQNFNVLHQFHEVLPVWRPFWIGILFCHHRWICNDKLHVYPKFQCSMSITSTTSCLASILDRQRRSSFWTMPMHSQPLKTPIIQFSATSVTQKYLRNRKWPPSWKSKFRDIHSDTLTSLDLQTKIDML